MLWICAFKSNFTSCRLSGNVCASSNHMMPSPSFVPCPSSRTFCAHLLLSCHHFWYHGTTYCGPLSLESLICVDFRPEDPSWLQATLPINSSGLGIRSASHLAPSTFLASADEASKLIHHLLPHNLVDITYSERDLALFSWSQDLPPDTPLPSSPSQQRSWDKPRVDVLFESLLSSCSDLESRARLLATRTRESGTWLHAAPVSSLGLQLSNDAVQITIGLRVGASIVQPHSCALCGKEVDHLARHGLSCKSSQGRTPRHNNLNAIIHRALSAAKVPSRLEPSGLNSPFRW